LVTIITKWLANLKKIITKTVTFTVTSEHILFYFLVFLFYTF